MKIELLTHWKSCQAGSIIVMENAPALRMINAGKAREIKEEPKKIESYEAPKSFKEKAVTKSATKKQNKTYKK